MPEPAQRPDEKPVPGPNGPRTPYPVNKPPAPDFIPGTPNNPPGQM